MASRAASTRADARPPDRPRRRREILARARGFRRSNHDSSSPSFFPSPSILFARPTPGRDGPRRRPAAVFGRAGVCKTTDRDSRAVYVLRAHFDRVSRTRRARRLRAVGRPARATRATSTSTRARQSPARATARARANARTARARPTGEGIDARATISATDRRRDRSIEDISAASAGGNGARDAREGEDARETGCRR